MGHTYRYRQGKAIGRTAVSVALIIGLVIAIDLWRGGVQLHAVKMLLFFLVAVAGYYLVFYQLTLFHRYRFTESGLRIDRPLRADRLLAFADIKRVVVRQSMVLTGAGEQIMDITLRDGTTHSIWLEYLREREDWEQAWRQAAGPFRLIYQDKQGRILISYPGEEG